MPAQYAARTAALVFAAAFMLAFGTTRAIAFWRRRATPWIKARVAEEVELVLRVQSVRHPALEALCDLSSFAVSQELCVGGRSRGRGGPTRGD